MLLYGNYSFKTGAINSKTTEFKISICGTFLGSYSLVSVTAIVGSALGYLINYI